MCSHKFTLELPDRPLGLGFDEGESILQIAWPNDVEINATCGGRGRCRSCLVKLVRGALPGPTVSDRSQLCEEEIGEGFRLACQCFPHGDATVAIAPLLPVPQAKLSEPLAARLRNGAGGQPEFVLVWARDSANRNDVVLTQGDIRQFQLAKAAILGGVVALADRAGVAYQDISEFMLAGGFGNYLDIRNARRVGLIPDLATKRISYIANAAGLGAQMALVSEHNRIRAGQLADMVTHVSLAGFAGFQKMYLNAMGFPKTASAKP